MNEKLPYLEVLNDEYDFYHNNFEGHFICFNEKYFFVIEKN